MQDVTFTHNLPTNDPNQDTEPQTAATSYVLNPYALAELVVGRKIDWHTVADVPALLSEVLATPYEELFDPKYEGPLYLGAQLDASMRLVPAHSPLMDVQVQLDGNDLNTPVGGDEIRYLRDLGPHFDTQDVGGIEVVRVELSGLRHVVVTLRLPQKMQWERLAHVFTPDVLRSVVAVPRRDQQVGSPPDWTPPLGRWEDTGRFFNEASEFFDPVQGAVANCYYIAALSAVAWARPYHINHMTRATGLAQQQFTNMIRFYKPDSGGVVDKEIQVTDAVPVNTSSGGMMYARSSEAGEIWPAVYEKAYAKLLTGHTGDRPDILATAWGDPVWATAQLTGGRRHYRATASTSAHDLWQFVRANSLSKRTFNPMTCWTYSSGDATPDKVIYADANVVGSHAYTVLGWDYVNGRKYLVIRNPWGNTEATAGALAGTIYLHDVSWWRPITLATVDGTFAMEASAFKKYFAGIGVAI